jgi:tetratricopeptide (TPR) repeat protein
LDAAVRENPKEPRFLRLLIEARLQLGTPADRVAAREALQQYLKLLSETRQSDVVAQMQLMDLYVQEMESAGKQMDYLRQISGAEGLPAEVRSHAALGLARVYLDRGQEKEARDAVEDAVRLDPLNGAAQQAKFQLIRTDPSATPAQRIAVMVAILRANPLQPDLMGAIAHELASAGLVDQAMSMYTLSFDTSRSLGMGRSLPDFTDFAAALVVAGQPRDAEMAGQQILEADPGNG